MANIAPSELQTSTGIVAELSTNFTLTWIRPSTDIAFFRIYYSVGTLWKPIFTSYSATATINLISINPDRGSVVKLAVSAVDSNGNESDLSNIVEVKLASLPTAPTWIDVDKHTLKTNEEIEVTWGGANSEDGNIEYYFVQCRMYDGTKWTNWNDVDYVTDEWCTFKPMQFFPILRNGCLLDIRVNVTSGYGLKSEIYRKISDYVSIVGSGIKVCVNGKYREGTAFIRTGGVWRQGTVYVNHNSQWEEGV